RRRRADPGRRLPQGQGRRRRDPRRLQGHRPGDGESAGSRRGRAHAEAGVVREGLNSAAMAELTFSIEQRFYASVRAGALPQVAKAWTLEEAGVSGDELVEMFESQLLSRQLDLNARRMHAARQGFYTIGSSGHEGNAAI